jgi:hypothetical protein
MGFARLHEFWFQTVLTTVFVAVPAVSVIVYLGETPTIIGVQVTKGHYFIHQELELILLLYQLFTIAPSRIIHI